MKVTYVDHMGTDLSVVNAARVSFGKKSYADSWESYDPEEYVTVCIPSLRLEDKRLIQFLARGCTSGDWDKLLDEVWVSCLCPEGSVDCENSALNEIERVLKYVKRMPEHWTPFGHTAITLHIKAPIFVARQLGKHQVGMVWNEVSRRYVDEEPELYWPEVIRSKADNVKQGSGDAHPTWNHGVGTGYYSALKQDLDGIVDIYNALIKDGVCAEQARMILPQNMYTEWYWTGNLYGFANIYNLRTDKHTQKETQEVAHQIGSIIEPLFPVSWEALTK